MLSVLTRVLVSSLAASIVLGVSLWSHPGPGKPADGGTGFDSRDGAEVPALAPVMPAKTAADTSAGDGRVGKVTDWQGVVAIRPGMASRWSPLVSNLPLCRGDWLRTDARGANALTLRMLSQAEIVLGPGTIAEIVSPGQLRVSAGELRITAPAKGSLVVGTPDGTQTAVTGENRIYRVQGEKLLPIAKEPLWLRGYEGKTADASIGTLLAKVDGRDVPLAVGYHKVAIDIRDQIARTTIEESFVNRTDAALEGVFYFPLPQDASIAGFGMWIGDELVEADVVEKQRAREIFETILRQRRDPALLEWTGGNIFKARVFPILAHSEKRITITYTQVLPLRNSRYHYQYALQSEMLKQHPLRNLEIDLKIASAVPLRSVESPTHQTRNSLTAHSAHVEFSAQEYTPTRDFEVTVEVDGRQSGAEVLSHRRGEDGYFMVQVSPPGGTGAAVEPPGAGGATAPQPTSRPELLPDSEPMELLVLADTSASMDDSARRLQGEFIAALLGCLMPKDRWNLAVCDVDCRWAFPSPTTADAKQIERARQILAARTSLGWTDLDRAVQATWKQCGPKTHVVYVGDGIVTTGDADPVAFAKRLRRMADGKPGTFHAVATGSSFEPGVLRAIAAVGGGSLRHLSGATSVPAAARDLLAEIAQPGLRNAKIEFRGIRTARVYPETLPNLPLGTQQIIVGRYLPEARSQAGEIVVTGTLSGKPVRYSAQVLLPPLSGGGAGGGSGEGDEGNSFIPRLWARMHLDALLEQGASAAVRDEIVALGERYHIVTPYTSFLVLESDADRERFKVRRQFGMRDGERFFATGRDQANFDLAEQQIRRAGAWRLGLRSQVQKQLSGLGRDTEVMQSLPDFEAMGGGVGGLGGGMGGSFGGMGMGGMSMGGMGGMGGGMGGMGGGMGDMGGAPPNAADQSSGTKTDYGLGNPSSQTSPAPSTNATANGGGRAGADQNSAETEADLGGETAADDDVDGQADDAAPHDAADADAARPGMDQPHAGVSGAADLPVMAAPVWSLASRLRTPDTAQWTMLLFPMIPELPPGVAKSRSPWPAEALAISQKLLRTQQLAAAGNGLHIEVETKTFKPSWNELLGRSRFRAWLRGSSWLTRFEDDNLQTVVGWHDAKQCGAVLEGFQLGTLRASKSRDLRPFAPDLPFMMADNHAPTDVGIGTTEPLEEKYLDHVAQIKPESKGRVTLVITCDAVSAEERLLVDTDRGVVLKQETWTSGMLVSATTQSEFVEVAGAWWPSRSETTDGKGRPTLLSLQKFTALGPGEMDRLWKMELDHHDQVQFLRVPLPNPATARQAIAAGKASFEDEAAMLLHFIEAEQWKPMLEHLKKAEKLSGKPGMRWVHLALLGLARHHEEFKKLRLEAAQALAAQADRQSPADRLALAQFLLELSPSEFAFGPHEQLALSDALRPVFERQAAHVQAMKQWKRQRLNWLQAAGQMRENLSVHKRLAAEYPRDFESQRDYAQALSGGGEHQAARDWLDKVLTPEGRWEPAEEIALRGIYADTLAAQGRHDQLVDYLAACCQRESAWLADGCHLASSDSPWAIRGTSHGRYLTALQDAGRYKEADALIAQWLREGQRPPPLPAVVAARLDAAVGAALGRGYYANYHNSGPMDPRWRKPLAELVLCLLRHASDGKTCDTIMQETSFRNSEEYLRVCKEAARILPAEIDRLAPGQIERVIKWIATDHGPTSTPNGPFSDESSADPASSPFGPILDETRAVRWSPSQTPELGPRAWEAIAAALRHRWDAETNCQAKDQLGHALYQVLAYRVSRTAGLAFLRAQFAAAAKDCRADRARELFDALVEKPAKTPWAQGQEDEALSLLGQISNADDPATRLAEEVAALHRLTDCMLEARFAASAAAIAHPEKLTRTQLRAQRRGALQLARQGLAEQLSKAATTAGPKLAAWIRVERLYLKVRTGHNLDRSAAECWELLGPKPPVPARNGLADLLDDMLRHRCLAMLVRISCRTDSRIGPGGDKTREEQGKASSADRVIAYMEEEIKADPGDSQGKLRLVHALLAMGRTNDLQSRLRQWIAAGDATGAWRIALGYLAAEEGHLTDAIGLFEAVRAADGLLPDEYRALAGWYAATNQREAHDGAVLGCFEAMRGDELSEWISRQLEAWQSGETPPPRELSGEVPIAFRAALRKSSQPQEELRQLWEFYKATRDFRLPGALAESVLGCTQEQSYGVLETVSKGLTEMSDEAAADALAEQIAKVRQRSINEADRRALDILEMAAETRAAAFKDQPRGILNDFHCVIPAETRAAALEDQPGVHADRAMAAMRRAWKRRWSPGEPRLMAHVLEALGKIEHEGLAAERLRELESLLRDAPRGSEDRLEIAACTAGTLWVQSRWDDAIDRLEAALKEQEESGEGGLPGNESRMPDGEMNGILSQLINYLEDQRHFAHGEAILKKRLVRAENQQQAAWYANRLYELYVNALAADGEVSLGRGATLYRAVEQKLQGELVGLDKPTSIDRLLGLYTVANKLSLPAVTDDLRRFAFRRLPELVHRPSDQYRWKVMEIARVLREIAGPREALLFLIERIEAEPAWVRHTGHGQNLDYCCRELNQWAKEVGDLGNLGPRLLRLNLIALRQYLRRQDPNSHIQENLVFNPDGHQAEFLSVAEEVLVENKDSGYAAAYIAQWLYTTANSRARAIEVLLDAQRRELLDRAGRDMLTEFLMEQGRYADAIPILERLIGHPDDLRNRMHLMRAYFRTKQPQQLAELLKTTDARFRNRDGWQGDVMAKFGRCCLDCDLFEQAAGYYQEAITNFQRGREQSDDNRDDKRLSDYYQSLATALLEEGKTVEAIDAAAAALVSLPRDRRDADLLGNVIGKAPDLDDCVARLDRRARETGLDSPIIRREIGRAYLRKQNQAKALEQLRLAVNLQPNDEETHKALMECYDQNDKPAAINEILRWREIARRDIELYAELSERLQAIDLPEEAERARASIIEVLPAETESHKLLAEMLQDLDRWAEASAQWRQVARIRSLEPTGLLGLAAAEIHEKQWQEAKATLKTLRQTNWPARFSEVDNQIRELEEQLAAGLPK